MYKKKKFGGGDYDWTFFIIRPRGRLSREEEESLAAAAISSHAAASPAPPSAPPTPLHPPADSGGGGNGAAAAAIVSTTSLLAPAESQPAFSTASEQAQFEADKRQIYK